MTKFFLPPSCSGGGRTTMQTATRVNTPYHHIYQSHQAGVSIPVPSVGYYYPREVLTILDDVMELLGEYDEQTQQQASSGSSSNGETRTIAHEHEEDTNEKRQQKQ